MFAMFVVAGVTAILLVYCGKNRIYQMMFTFAIFVMVIVTTNLVVRNYGAFGNPAMLTNQNAPFRVLSVTRIDDRSTAIILRDRTGKVIPMMFHSSIMADTNGFYNVVNNGIDDDNLELIH